MAREGVYENNPSGDLAKGIDDEFLGRLNRKMMADSQAIDHFRLIRTEITRQQVGSYYGLGGTDYEVPLPLITTFLNIHSKALVPKEPRVSLSTFDEAMDPAVDAMMNWQNDWYEEIDLAETYRRVVHDALIMEGRLKICLLMPEIAEAGYRQQAGQPTFQHIDEDDWCEDMKARHYKDRTYYAHSYFVPLEIARDIFAKRKLEATNPSDLLRGDYQSWTISAGTERQEDIEDFIKLWEVHLIRKGIILTIKDDNGYPSTSKKDILRVRKYVGPRSGNCISLSFYTVSGNLRGLSPASILMPLHLAANESYRKLITTASNYKAIVPIRGGLMTADGKAVKEANHMDIIAADNANEINEKRFNLPPAELQLFVQDLRSAFDFMGGGLATLGGRGAQTGTVGQEKILAANAGAGVSDMAQTTTAFITKASRILNWYLWYHPTNEYPSRKQLPGLNDTFGRVLYPYNDELPSHEDLVAVQALMREGPMPRIKVDPYSLTHMTPSEKSQFLSSIVAETAPYAAIGQQQGVFFDFAEWLNLKSILGDEPLVKKLFKFQGKPVQPEGGEDAGLNKEVSAKPPETKRTYERISSGGGQRDQMADMRSQMMAASANGQQ